MTNNLTKERLDQIMKRHSLYSPITFFDIKNSFWSLFYNCHQFIINIFGYIFCDKVINSTNKKYIDNIVATNNIDYITKILNQHKGTVNIFTAYDQCMQNHPFLNEINIKTNDIEKKLSDCSRSLVSYVGGNCWLNSKLSNDIELSDNDTQILSDINKLVNGVAPLSYPVSLFHGLEKYTNYGKMTDSLHVKGFLSKSLSLDIAKRFATSVDYFSPKFLLVNYPIGSKHIHPDCNIFNEEFEYLTHSGEKLKIVDIKQYYNFARLYTFYVCEPLIKQDT